MRRKTINAILCKKFDDWVASIDSPEVQNRVLHNTIITGGCIPSMLMNEKVNDYDVYFRDFDTAIAVVRHYAYKFKSLNPDKVGPMNVITEEDEGHPPRIKVVIKSRGVAAEEEDAFPNNYSDFPGETVGDPGEIEDTYEDTLDKALEVDDSDDEIKYRPIFLSTNAITLSNRIQLVHRFYGEPDQIHENYDFVHCTNYWDSKTRKVVLNEEALEAILTKELRYVGSRYPVCSIFRLRKFIRKGWTINAGQMLKICMAMNDLDLKDFKVLEDQLTGVDCYYFMQVLERVKEKDPEKLDSAYLIEIINRMF